jgi:hypothetical protein
MGYLEHRAEVWAKTNGHCWYCGKLMNPFDDFTIDHMDSQKNGGTDELPNLIPACHACNSRKHKKGVEEFRAYLLKKGEVKFWGEHLIKSISTTEIVQAESREPQQEPTSFSNNCPCPYTWLFVLSMRATVRENAGFPLTLLALMENAHGWRYEPATCCGWLDLERLNSWLCIDKAQILSVVYALERAGFLFLTSNDDGRVAYWIEIHRLCDAANRHDYAVLDPAFLSTE